jgi:hypothetical protein
LRIHNARGWAGKLFELAVHRRFRPEAIDSGSSALAIVIDDEGHGYFHTLTLRAAAR